MSLFVKNPKLLYCEPCDYKTVSKKDFNKDTDMYSIPIIFFHPNDTSLQGKSEIVAQQIDILPSIMDYINFDMPFLCYGNSLLDESGFHYSINYFNSIYLFIKDNKQ